MGDIADAITEEMGAPAWLAQNAQGPAGMGHLMTAVNALKAYQFEEDRGTSRIVKEPIGVVGFVTPWNWPMNQICAKVGPALATGCTIVLKPSEIAPFLRPDLRRDRRRRRPAAGGVQHGQRHRP